MLCCAKCGNYRDTAVSKNDYYVIMQTRNVLFISIKHIHIFKKFYPRIKPIWFISMSVILYINTFKIVFWVHDSRLNFQCFNLRWLICSSKAGNFCC